MGSKKNFFFGSKKIFFCGPCLIEIMVKLCPDLGHGQNPQFLWSKHLQCGCKCNINLIEDTNLLLKPYPNNKKLFFGPRKQFLAIKTTHPLGKLQSLSLPCLYKTQYILNWHSKGQKRIGEMDLLLIPFPVSPQVSATKAIETGIILLIELYFL